MDLSIMPDILKVLGNGFGNTDLTNGNTKRLHQFEGIMIGAISRTESRHRDTKDALTIETKFIESLNSNKQGKRGIETTTYTYDSLGATNMV